MTSAWWLWVRADLRRRRRPAVVLVVLVALAGGVVMAAVAGGRRNGTAVERSAALTSPAHAWVLLNQPGFDWDRVRALPEVAAVAEFPVAGFEVEGRPDIEEGWPAGSPEAMTDVEVPIVVEGRLADPSRVDEVNVSSRIAQRGVAVGDRLTLAIPTPEAQAAWLTGEPAPPEDGPRQAVTVVGVTKNSFFADGLQTTHAFFERYQANLAPPELYVNAVVRLRSGASMAAFQADMAALAGRPVEMRDAAAELKRTGNATHLERDALYGFAAAAAVAALVLVGQAIVRMVTTAAHEVSALLALGFTRTGAAIALAAVPAAAALAGVVGAAGVAWALSERFPIGVGRRVEPTPGFRFDATVIGAGVGLGAALAVGGTLGLTLLALRRRPHAMPAGRSAIASAVAATNPPVTLSLGVRLALERSAGGPGVPVYPALVGAVVGVVGVAAALTFGDGLDRATGDASLYGQDFDAMIVLPGGSNLEIPDSLVDDLAARPEVESVAEARNAVLTIDGHDLPVVGLRPVSGDVERRPVRGRAARAPDEITLAPHDREILGVDIGEEVHVAGVSSPLTVVGEAFTPEISHTSYDRGAQMTDEGLRRFFPTDDELKFDAYLVGFREGTDVDAAIARINDDVAARQGVDDVLEPRTPVQDQENLAGVRRVPLALGGFLALLAVAAVGHALASTVRRRRRDLAVLRALGFTTRQARATVAWQATTLAVVGLVVGIPLGVALGRTIWRVVAEQAPMLYVAPFALVVLTVVPLAAVAVANGVAAWPGHRAARLRPADSLRTE